MGAAFNLPPPGTLLLQGPGPAAPNAAGAGGAKHRPELGGQHPLQRVGPWDLAWKLHGLCSCFGISLPKSQALFTGKGMQTGANSAQTVTAAPPPALQSSDTRVPL